jgi:beta-glucosidase
MAVAIGDSMRELGVHQGLAPVLDVIRDPRWGRVDECISEDPYLVGTVGTAYVRGLQQTGIHATLKHFLGYSASQSGRNHAPVHAGPREISDVFLPPFEMALRDGGAKSVMNSYTEIDGVPVASSSELLTDLLRGDLGFEGVVVADYFAVAFLEKTHQIAADRGEAAALALEAGIDVELPTGDAYLEPLTAKVRAGEVPEELVERAVLRVLAQKEELGLLDPGAFDADAPATIDLDAPRHRDIARRLAEESIVLLSNDGTLPLARAAKLAVVGPNADRAEALQGCYSFANHVLAHHPGTPIGIEMPTVAEALAASFDVTSARGCEVEGDDRSGFEEAASVVSAADIAVVVVGDQAGLFGRGTVGEGNDAESLDLPGVQRELVERLIATGTPIVMVLLTGRPYALDWALSGEGPAAVVQSFFPGEEGGTALDGSVSPSGRLPVSLPRSAGSQPFSYLHPPLAGPSGVTSTDSTPVRTFGFGLSYASFAYSEFSCDVGESITARVTVTNTSDIAGTDIVQLYGHDVAASVTRPVAQLLGYARVPLEAGESRTVAFDVPVSRFAFSDRRMRRVVEAGEAEVWIGTDAATDATARTTIVLPHHDVTADDRRIVEVSLSDAERAAR